MNFDLNTVCFSLTSGDARGLGILLSVCACAVGLCENVLIWMRGPGEYFGGLRMCLRSHSRDCAGQKPWAELCMRPTSTHLCAFLWMRVFFTPCPESRSLIGRSGSREHKWGRSNANETRDPLKQYPYCLSRPLIGYYPRQPYWLLVTSRQNSHWLDA